MGLEFIITNQNRTKELGYLKDASLDIDIGKYGVAENDFEITVSSTNRETEFDDGSLFYCEGTEWGGLLQGKRVNTGTNELTHKGQTFRGLLTNEYVQPPEGESHLVLKGEANTCINTLISGKFDGLFEVDEIGGSGITVNYQVRDLNLLQALEKTLGYAGGRLEIQFRDGKAHLKAVPIQDLSDTIQYDNDYMVQMNVETPGTQYNHILALGKGELTERLRLNLYLQEDGSWGDVEFYSGLKKKTYKYENSNTETEADLREEAIDNINTMTSTETLDISFEADEANLFDIVAAEEQITGIKFKEQITQKILKGTTGDLNVSYKVGE